MIREYLDNDSHRLPTSNGSEPFPGKWSQREKLNEAVMYIDPGYAGCNWCESAINALKLAKIMRETLEQVAEIPRNARARRLAAATLEFVETQRLRSAPKYDMIHREASPAAK